MLLRQIAREFIILYGLIHDPSDRFINKIFNG